MSNKITQILLVLILTLGAFLRLWQLGQIPVHLTQDETALGYNAYSILKTGRDEYGKWFPLVFKSFGDYKPGLYVYAAVPSVAVFGLTEFAVRLPSAVSGILAIYLIYLISNSLFPKPNIFNFKFGLIAGFILAVSPWHIHLSRGAWETNLALTLTLGGIFFFLKGISKGSHFYTSAVFFGLTLITYQGAKLSTPIVLACLLTFLSSIKHSLKKLIGPLLVLTLLGLPVLFSLRYGAGRLKVFSMFSYPRNPADTAEIKRQDNTPSPGFSYDLFHSEPLYQARVFLLHYFTYFSPRFLLFEGDWSTPRHATPYHGVIYVFEIAFLLSGIYYLVKGNSVSGKFILLWLFLSPLPGALSRDLVQAVRSFNFVIPLTITGSVGLVNLFILSKKFQTAFLLFCVVLYTLFLSRFIDLEFIHATPLFGSNWNYGYKQIVATVSPIQKDYSQIIINQSFDQPYIFFLFFQKYDPRKWWPQANLIPNPQGDAGFIGQLDNITFRPLAWSGDKYLTQALVIGNPLSMDPSASLDPDVSLIEEISIPGTSVVTFRIFKTKK